MSRLQSEIALNKVQVKSTDAQKAQRKELVDGLLDSVSGGWVKAFVNWPKRL